MWPGRDLLSVVIAFASGCMALYYWRESKEHRKLLEHEKQKRADERNGRTNAEEKIRKLLLQIQAMAPNQAHSSNEDGIDESAHDKGSSQISQIVYRVIGNIDSCYRRRLGTPRQGKLVPNSLARLKINGNIILPKASLDGLNQYSHVWILFIFHMNTNVTKDHHVDNILEGKGQVSKYQATFKAYVKPPRLGGAKVGLYATRTPHRPNNIGLTLAKLESVDLDQGIITISGHDLVDGTPVIDVKPFLPLYDQAHGEELRVPYWIDDSPVQVLDDVVFEQNVLVSIEDYISSGKSAFYQQLHSFLDVTKDVIRQDIRSVHRRKVNDEQEIHHVLFDNAVLGFRVQRSIAIVAEFEYVPDHRKHRLVEDN